MFSEPKKRRCENENVWCFESQGGINCGVGSPRKFVLFRLTARKRHFRGKKYRILTFRDKTASIFQLNAMHANNSNEPVTHSNSLSGSLWLSQAHSGSLSGSLSRSSAHKVLARLSTLWIGGHSLSRPDQSKWEGDVIKYEIKNRFHIFPGSWLVGEGHRLLNDCVTHDNR